MTKNYCCPLPTERSFQEYIKELDGQGGGSISNDLRSRKNAHPGDLQTCWEEFDTSFERIQHYIHNHPTYFAELRQQNWNAFKSKTRVLNP